MTVLEQAQKIREAMDYAGVLLTEKQAAQVAFLYQEWTPHEDDKVTFKNYPQGSRCRYQGRVYECRQEHQSQPLYSPDLVPALWKVLEVEHNGTVEDPIPYVTGMEIFSGKYYTENNVLYLCIRDSGTPLYHNLANLIGLYVEVV